MNNRILLVIATTETVNVPAVSTALEGYETRQVGDHAWIVKTELGAQDFLAKTRAFNGGKFAIFPVDAASLRSAVLPGDLASYAGVSAAA